MKPRVIIKATPVTYSFAGSSDAASPGRGTFACLEFYSPSPLPVIAGYLVQNDPYAVASPLTITTALQRAHAHWRAGQVVQAEQLCKRVMAVVPNQPDALHLLGVMAHTYGKSDLALAYLRAATRVPHAPALYHSNLAEICRQQGLLDEADGEAKHAVRSDPLLMDAWLNLGIIAQERGDLALSLTCLRKVVAARPDCPQTHTNLANTLQRLNDLEPALRHYQQALQLDATYVQAYSNQAALLCKLGRLDEAEKMAEQAIALAPQCVEAYLNIAEIVLRRGRIQDAHRWLDALFAFAPTHINGQMLRARLWWSQARHDDALTLLRQAVAQSPENIPARTLLAQLLSAMGKNEAISGADEPTPSHDAACAVEGMPR